MTELEKETFALSLLKSINEKRAEIKRLTCEILELENECKNVTKIKQNVQGVLNAVASCSNGKGNDLEILKIQAGLIFRLIRAMTHNADGSISPASWGILIKHELEDFCIDANAWNPITYNFSKKSWKIEFKNLNFGAVINNK